MRADRRPYEPPAIQTTERYEFVIIRSGQSGPPDRVFKHRPNVYHSWAEVLASKALPQYGASGVRVPDGW